MTVMHRMTLWIAALAVAAVMTAWRWSADQASTATPGDAAPRPVSLLGREQEAGRLLFLRYCVFCHGSSGDGNGINAPNVAVPVPDFTRREWPGARSDVELAERIAGGARSAGRPPLCPAWGSRLDASELHAIVAYVRTLPASVRTRDMP